MQASDLRGPAPSGAPALKPEHVKFIAVHCSATPFDRDIGASDIDRMHRNQGWLKIGYHFVIRRDGTVETGRALNERGAHVLNFNDCSVGVCLIGGVDQKMQPSCNYTGEQLNSLQTLLKSLQEQFPDAFVQGHRDFPRVAKACPSFNVRHWMLTGKVLP